MRATRRTVITGALAAGLSAGLDGIVPVPGLKRLAFAAGMPGHGLFVLVHLRGGCDSLNLVSPADDPEFVAARVSDLRVLTDGPEPGHALRRGGPIDFRLHGAARGLAELYDGRHLAIVHAAGLTDATRSHFVATDMIEHGVADGASLTRTTDGWLSRYLGACGTTSPTLAVSAAPAPSGAFARWAAALAVPDLGGGFAAPGGAQVDEVLGRLYLDAPGDVGAAGRTALGAMRSLDARLPRDGQGKYLPYQPPAGVNYDAAGDFARPLRTVAALVRMEVGLAVASVDMGGWDTHEYQPGRFHGLVERLSAGLSAFYADIGRDHGKVTIVVLSEFGRRLRSNRSSGTDHGRAGAILVLGTDIAGGRLLGPWPGLAAEKLDEGVDLAVATDYRAVLGEVLAHHGGRDAASAAFPGFKPPAPLGFFAS